MKIAREHLEAGVGVILRIPALFIIEAWYRSDTKDTIATNSKDVELIASSAHYLALVLAVALATLPLKKLVMFYMHVISGFLLAAAYSLSQKFVEVEKAESPVTSDALLAILDDRETTVRLTVHLVAQCIIAAIIAYLLDIRDWTKFTMLVFAAPMLARISGLPVRDLHAVHNFSTIFTALMIMFYIFNNIGYALDLASDGINKAREAARILGWLPVLVAFWHTIMLPVQLLLFWVVLFCSNLYVIMYSDTYSAIQDGTLIVILASIGDCCATPISLFALCVTISYSSYYILTLTKVFLQGREGLVRDNDLMRGWTEGFTMLLIAFQTGILELKPLQRAFLMSILLFIVASSLIQSMYEITDPILLGLSASHNKSILKHVRAVLLCTFLWIFPLYMTYTICQYFDLDFWLMIIVSSCLLTSVQVVGSLVVYSLFMYDAIRTEPWEGLDDVIYYTRSTVRVLEFVVAVFVVCYGIKESFRGEWSWINASILIIHCYFNVWQRLQSGWRSFLLRREAVKKLESLPEASEEELVRNNDVCAICFQEMRSARMTKCGHYFHGFCLRKWLYVKDACPMCHQPINEISPAAAAVTGQIATENLNNDGEDGYESENDSEAGSTCSTECMGTEDSLSSLDRELDRIAENEAQD